MDGKESIPESARHDDGPLESGANTHCVARPDAWPARAVHRRVELKPLISRKSARITHNRSGADDCATLYSSLATRCRAAAWFTATRSGSAWLAWRITWCITVVPVESSTRIPKFKKRWSSATIPEATTASWQNNQTAERSQQADKTCHRRTSR